MEIAAWFLYILANLLDNMMFGLVSKCSSQFLMRVQDASLVTVLSVSLNVFSVAGFYIMLRNFVGLTTTAIALVIRGCDTCAAIEQAKRMKPLWGEGRWQKYKYGEAWQVDYITLPQPPDGKRYVLTMVAATTWVA